MQVRSDGSHRLDEIKTQFRAREGYYRLMNSPDYSQRSQRAMGFGTGTTNSGSSTVSNEKTIIKISLVTINEHNDSSCEDGQLQSTLVSGNDDTRTSKKNWRSKGARDMKICFNVGKELFVYNYDGVRTGPDASNPIYKRFYKGSSPTCHDFNQATASSGSISLLVGFVHGQVQLIDLNGYDDHEGCKEFNSERLIDRTRVTCVKWLPNSSSLFLVAHASGQLYLYKDDLTCGPTAPIYQLYKQSDGVAVFTCKTKTTRNPIYRWSIGGQSSSDNFGQKFGSSTTLFKMDTESCSLNEFVFSPCAKYLACVSQDGFLRVYCYDSMELVGRARSYYGGLTCACWSPDGKYVITGGEDDLITVWSFVERRVVARGVGHKSWVSVVAFDTFHNNCNEENIDVDNYDEDDEEVDSRYIVDDEEEEEIEEFTPRNRITHRGAGSSTRSPASRVNQNQSNHYACSNFSSASHARNLNNVTYRFGSVAQDTQLCLWDLSDDLLQQPVVKSRTNPLSGFNSSNNLTASNSHQSNLASEGKQLANKTVNSAQDSFTNNTNQHESESCKTVDQDSAANSRISVKGSAFTKTFSLVGKRDKRYFSKYNDKTTNNKGLTDSIINDRLVEDPSKLLGTPICPKMNEVPLIEPTVCKKISFERLTSLIFCRGGFITSCQDGYVFSWARPSRKTINSSPGQSNEELRVIDVGTSSAV